MADSKKKLDIMELRHSASHVLAQAVLDLYPDAKLAIGPAIAEGFYYDFDVKEPFTPEDLKKIEKKMNGFARQDNDFVRKEISKKDALQLFKAQPYKLELINELDDGKITTYTNGNFTDLCKGPHVDNTKHIRAFKLVRAAGAYWRGDAKNKMLQRIYGVVFPSKDELKEYLHKLEEAAKRDHRKLVKDLDIAMFHEYAPGAPFFLQYGSIIYNQLIDFIRAEYARRGYEEVITPQLYNKKLWEQSGHWEHYHDNMFVIEVEGEEHSLKPMNCPSHCLIYNRNHKSYRDLPIRIADFCNLHRNELSGTLTGMTRVRKFAQDDAHIFCTLDQVEEEVIGVLDFIQYVWTKVFDFKVTYYLSTRPDKAMGDKKLWDKAEKMLEKALKKAGISYELKEGDGAFYGPKIDIDLEDALGRKWQCPTCQLDFNLPERFECMYEDAKGKRQQCVMIHRAVLGSVERFMAMLIEHYAGKLPLWLSPVQARVLPVSDDYMDYAEDVYKNLAEAGVRVEIDRKKESIPKKVREAQKMKIPYILVVGEKEAAEGTISARTRDNEVHDPQKIADFVKQLQEEIDSKK